MSDPAEQKTKECFIITPVGSENTDIRRAAEGVIDAGITPILNDLGFNVNVPHRLYGSGSITKQIINMIVDNDLAIANLTGLNPNVMYELGIRHCARKPVIHICENGTSLPFDIQPERTIFYVNDMAEIPAFRKKIKEAIKAVMAEVKVSNPVYEAVESELLVKEAAPNDKSPLDYIIKRLDRIEQNIGNQLVRVGPLPVFDSTFHTKRGMLKSPYLVEKHLLEQLDEFKGSDNPIPDEFVNAVKKWGKTYNQIDKAEQMLSNIYKWNAQK